ncbi:protein FAM236A-like [Echinops telfairi]|uniref:Protein FAM236A-like n=1 Tax=Echinops telfairi TaxID=9371 RepID=A0AC55D327_ECHTE|nr:protein FAM236A-like [Echinops telfairi]
MIFKRFRPPPEPTMKGLLNHAEEIVLSDTIENPPNSSVPVREPTSPRGSWRIQFQRTLACFTKFFRRGYENLRNAMG